MTGAADELSELLAAFDPTATYDEDRRAHQFPATLSLTSSHSANPLHQPKRRWGTLPERGRDTLPSRGHTITVEAMIGGPLWPWRVTRVVSIDVERYP